MTHLAQIAGFADTHFRVTKKFGGNRTTTQVIIYEAGTQKEVSRSEPGAEHRFALDAGTYDIFVANSTGKGKPFVLERAEVKGEETVEKNVPLDAGELSAPSKPEAL